MAPAEKSRWVARVVPGSVAGGTEGLLGLSVGLDVWERDDEALVVAASEQDLAELERRRLATVERIATVEDWLRSREQGG